MLKFIFFVFIKFVSHVKAAAAAALFSVKIDTCHAGKYHLTFFIAAHHHSKNHP
ncbi:hypothetical protein IKI14_00160 [bacterium]|nr:hypothetical protein [bacterium]